MEWRSTAAMYSSDESGSRDAIFRSAGTTEAQAADVGLDLVDLADTKAKGVEQEMEEKYSEMDLQALLDDMRDDDMDFDKFDAAMTAGAAREAFYGGRPGSAPLAPVTTGAGESYTWVQRDKDPIMTVKVSLPEGVRSKSLVLDLTSTTLDLSVKGWSEPIISGTLAGSCRPDDSFWTVEDGVLFLELEKSTKFVSTLTWDGLLIEETDPQMAVPTTKCFLDVSIGDEPSQRIVVGLFGNAAPLTCANFERLCAGDSGDASLHFKGSTFHRVIPGFMAQGGDFTNNDGTGGRSIYGEKFQDETFRYKHSAEGLLAMANSGPDSNGSQFYLTLAATPWLDRRHVVFGRVLDGLDVLKVIEAQGSQEGTPGSSIVIADCGVLAS